MAYELVYSKDLSVFSASTNIDDTNEICRVSGSINFVANGGSLNGFDVRDLIGQRFYYPSKFVVTTKYETTAQTLELYGYDGTDYPLVDSIDNWDVAYPVGTFEVSYEFNESLLLEGIYAWFGYAIYSLEELPVPHINVYDKIDVYLDFSPNARWTDYINCGER